MSVVDEFRGAGFSDVRLARRLETIVEGLASRPSLSFPDAARSDSALEATYRFLSNDQVTPAQILAPHIAATCSRANGRTVYVVHDTTEFRFEDREGMGRLSGESAEGFLCHASLAVEPGEERMPLGVVSLHNWIRDTRTTPPKRKNHHSFASPESRESNRWLRQAQASEEVMGGTTSVIHLMDSEADAYSLLSALVANNSRFVIRLHVDRKVVDEKSARLSEKLETLYSRVFRDVRLSPRQGRPQNAGRRNPPRVTRHAELHIAASIVTLPATRPVQDGQQPTVTLNVVRVFEPNPPEGCVPVEWRLATTEPIENERDLAGIVDAYRARWVIEEFFKALKSGCAFEKRQLESYDALLNALAIFAPIAYDLLRLRTVADQLVKVDAAKFFRPSLWAILRKHKDLNVGPQATVHDCYLAIARLGGHIKNNGRPGWLVLARGYEKLLAIEEGFLISSEI